MTDIGVLLRLGRVSNLPTVWTNLLAGMAVTGAVAPGALALLVPAASLFYVAGMFLNDAFDREIDAVERPERPIPSGQVEARAVFVAAAAMMAAGLALVAPLGLPPLAAAAALCAAIVYYDADHKGNPASPLVMGGCRALVYVLAAHAVGGAGTAWMLPSLALLAYVAGLTYAARQENLARFTNAWPLAMLAVPVAVLLSRLSLEAVPFVLLFLAWTAHGLRLILSPAVRDIRRAVGTLIAGISLLDAALIATAGAPLAGTAAVAAFGLTLALHRKVAGT
ncbi:MAG: UbiA family prenyltransferase [Pseudomonadota bacterium]